MGAPAIVGAGLQIASSLMGASASRKEAARQRDAATMQNVVNQRDLTDQQNEVNYEADAAVSDRMREARAAVGLARAAAAEGVGNLGAQVNEIMFNAGTDQNRIAHRAAVQVNALQKQKLGSALGMQSTVTAAADKAKAGKLQGFLGAVGAGVQLYGAHVNRTSIDARQTQTNPDLVIKKS
jgi:hypothetical protein